jgi:probable rRNA maturation factor
VDVRDDASFGAAGVAWCAQKLREALGVLDATGEVRIAIVDDETMTAEHVRALGVDGTTDVITFDLTDGESGATRELDVDLLVCADEAERRARERGIPAERELLLYMLHGVLHCLGYDDTNDDAYRAMHAREDEVLDAIGVGATFSDEREDDLS